MQLQQKIKQESEQFRAWKASREKEVMQVYFDHFEAYLIDKCVMFSIISHLYSNTTCACRKSCCSLEDILTWLFRNLMCVLNRSLYCILKFDQLKKEGRRNEYEMHKLMALNQKQKLVSTYLYTFRQIISIFSIIMAAQSSVVLTGFAKKDRRGISGDKKTQRAFRKSKGVFAGDIE